MKDISINLSDLRNVKGFGPKMEEKVLEYLDEQERIKLFKSEYVPSDKYRMNEDVNLWQGDCLELMNHIPDKSIDMILADLPYGTTACSWDEIIPFEPLWSHYKRIVKDNGVILLFGSEPFATKLRMSNLDWYRYDWYWDKGSGGNFTTAKYQPLRRYENVMVFYDKSCFYNPQMELRNKNDFRVSGKSKLKNNSITGLKNREGVKSSKHKYPTNKLYYNRMGGELNSKHRLHPTQKPVDLLEYLIKTYTNENMIVLDNTMGSGSTGVACRNLNRRFIGIELDEKYFEIAKKRIDECESQDNQ